MDQKFFFILIKFGFLFQFASAEDLQVCIPNLGCIQGTYMPGYISEKFEAYLGVPFAKPPVGNLRFKSPQPLDPWEGVLSADSPKPDCIQRNDLLDSPSIVGEEDCLYLNIYRPIGVEKPLPVMFYIYAGGFFTGSIRPSVVGPAYFMDTKEVIIVIANYRLGAFGFLSTGTVELPGNYGLKDQQFALKWIQTYISAFGGDPQAVTVFGHSIGSTSIHLHMLNNESKDLFRNAILASGNGLGPYAQVLDNSQQYEVVARKLALYGGFSDAESFSYSELVEALQSLDPETLITGIDEQKVWHQFPRYFFRASIEQPNWPDAFLIDDPETLMKNGKWNQVPNLNTVASAYSEGVIYSLIIWFHDDLREEFNAQFDERLWEQLEFPKDLPIEKRSSIINSLVDMYMQGTHELNNATSAGFTELFGDYSFYYPNWKTTKYYLKYAEPNNPLYYIKYNYRGPNSYGFLYTGGEPIDYGIVHIDDTAFLFQQPALFPNEYPKISAEARFVREMIEIYINFAKNGEVKGLDPCTEAVFNTPTMCDFLEIRNQEGEGFEKIITNQFDMNRIQMWDNIYNDLYS